MPAGAQPEGRRSRQSNVSYSFSLLIGYETLVPLGLLLTLDGSKSGTASSLMRLMLVAARDGMFTVVGEVAEDILAGSWDKRYRRQFA